MRRALTAFLILALVAVIGGFLFIRSSVDAELVRSTIEQQLAARVGQPVRIGGAGVSFYPRMTVDLSDVSIGSPEAIRLGAVHIAVDLRDLWTRRVKDAEVVVANSRVVVPLPFPLVASGPSSGSSAEGSSFKVESVRRIAIRDLVLAGGPRTLHVDLESSLDGNRVAVHELTARAERLQVAARGTISDLATLEANFEASADPLDLDELIAIASAFTTRQEAGGGDGAGTTMHVAVKLAAQSGQFASYTFRHLTATLDATPTRLVLSPLVLGAFGGSFKGRLEAESRGDTPRLHLNGQLSGVDVAELLAASGSPGGLTGRLSGTIALNGTGSETQTLVRSSQGTLAVAVTDGTFPHLDMVRTIVLAFGKPSGSPPEGSGSVFSRLGGTFALGQGVLQSNDISLRSRDFDLAGNASLRIETGEIDARADVVLSEELTAQAGTDLRRYAQDDGRVVVPAQIRGTLQQPTISIDLAAASRRALGNELKRRATTFFEGLLKKKR